MGCGRRVSAVDSCVKFRAQPPVHVRCLLRGAAAIRRQPQRLAQVRAACNCEAPSPIPHALPLPAAMASPLSYPPAPASPPSPPDDANVVALLVDINEAPLGAARQRERNWAACVRALLQQRQKYPGANAQQRDDFKRTCLYALYSRSALLVIV